MFKKTLVAAAIGALPISAYAADVNVYGVIDYGMVYNHTKYEATDSDSIKEDSFTMDSGVNSATRFGLRGSEDLGNGLKVGFKLENGFSSDSGKLGEDRLFGREATVNVSGGFGTVYMGRLGTLVSDTGSVGFYGAMASAFGSGWSDNIAGHTKVMAAYTSRLDNVIAYVSPTFAGTTIYAQYAMGGDDGGDENKTNTDRYAALGAKWAGGPFEVGALVDWTNKSNAVLKIGTTTLGSNDYTIEDAYTFNLAGSYDCGFAKTFLAVQYFKDASDAAGILGTTMDLVEISGFTDDDYDAVRRVFSFDGFGVHLSTQFDALGGTWKAGIGYMDGEANVNSTYAAVPSFEAKPDLKAYTASVGYEYALSKRTTLYTGMGYVQREVEFTETNSTSTKYEGKAYDFVAGLVHRF